MLPGDCGNWLELESLFPEVYYDGDNSNCHDNGFWDGDGMGMVPEVMGYETAADGFLQGGLDGIGMNGFEVGVGQVDGYEIDRTDFANMNNNIGPSPSSSSAPITSALPTPASSSGKRPGNKRPASNKRRTTSPLSESSSEPSDKIIKRQRNTEAARRYRQRKVDRVTELEEALAAMTKERDDFKIKLARSEAEVEVLRRLVGGRKED